MLALALGCAQTPWEDVLVVDMRAQGSDLDAERVKAELDGFAASAASEGAALDLVRLVSEVEVRGEPHVGDQARANGGYNPRGREIELRTSSAARHELCHALDRAAGLSRAHRDVYRDVGLPPEVGSAILLPGHVRTEMFALLCAIATPPPVARAAQDECRFPMYDARTLFTQDLAFPGTIPALGPTEDWATTWIALPGRPVDAVIAGDRLVVQGEGALWVFSADQPPLQLPIEGPTDLVATDGPIARRTEGGTLWVDDVRYELPYAFPAGAVLARGHALAGGHGGNYVTFDLATGASIQVPPTDGEGPVSGELTVFDGAIWLFSRDDAWRFEDGAWTRAEGLAWPAAADSRARLPDGRQLFTWSHQEPDVGERTGATHRGLAVAHPDGRIALANDACDYLPATLYGAGGQVWALNDTVVGWIVER